MARKLDEPQERGDFFKSLGTLLAGFVANSLEEAVTGLGPKLLRPPGALDELEFLTKCTRCDKCMRACPENAILVAPPSAGLALKTPYSIREASPVSCAPPCPASPPARMRPWSGPSAPLAGKTVIDGPKAARMGTARVKQSLCVTWDSPDREVRACRICVDRCPYPGEALRLAEPGEGETVGHPVVDAETCTGCGICVFACPAEPGAIVVDPRRG